MPHTISLFTPLHSAFWLYTPRTGELAANLKQAGENDEAVCIIVGGHCARAEGLRMAYRIAQPCNTTVMVETFMAHAMSADTLQPRLQASQFHQEPENGPLTPDAVGLILANRSPENAVIAEESVTSSA